MYDVIRPVKSRCAQAAEAVVTGQTLISQTWREFGQRCLSWVKSSACALDMGYIHRLFVKT